MLRADFDQFDGKEVARLLALMEAQRRYYQEMVDALPEPVAVLAADQTIVGTNRAFRRSFGVRAEELRNKTLEQILNPLPPMARIPIRNWNDQSEIETLVVVQVAAVPSPAEAVAAQRAQALYNFAGQVAHDLNNPLMIVIGYAEELLESLPAGDPQRTHVSEILAAAQRISGLGTQLVDIARKHARPPAPVNIAEVVTGATAKIEGARLNRGPSPIMALADAEQLAEVILALAAGRNRVVLSWDLDAHQTRITVQSDAREDEQRRGASIFDPVLTKTVDPAAGMTLSRAYNIVLEWGGDITFTGSAFTIFLPRADSGGPASESAPKPAAEPGRESILVVEDDATIRELIVRILRREGYQVMHAASAEEALVATRTTPVRMLVTDVKLPGVGGPELARKLHAAMPALKVLYISGYTDDPTARTGSYPPGAAFLAKPFTLSALVAKVREALAP